MTHDSWLMYSQESEDEGKGDTSEGEASEAPKAKKQTAPKMPEKKKKKAENGGERQRTKGPHHISHRKLHGTALLRILITS